MAHRHKAISEIVRCFSGAVSRHENRAAHGGVTIIATCKCGAERQTNVNGNHYERGQWVDAIDLAGGVVNFFVMTPYGAARPGSELARRWQTERED